MSTEIFKKLNLKDQAEILVLNAPKSFVSELDDFHEATVLRDINEIQGIDFSLAFVIKQADLDEISNTIAERAVGDALIWFAYPKKSSKKYKGELSRDTGWHVIREAGFEPVRMVSMDEDWSAFRIRRADFIKQKK